MSTPPDPMSLATDGAGSTTTTVPDKNHFNGVKVFSATMAQERERLGEKITAWIAAHPSARIVDRIVTQSSDEAFHCLAITLFYLEG